MLATVGAAVVLAGCSAPDAGAQPPTTHDLLLEKAPSGFTSSVDTTLSVNQASSTLSTDPAATLAQLSSLGYSDGAEKVWVHGAQYVVDLVFQFDSTVGAGSFVAFERSQLSGRPAVTLFDDQDIPGAQGLQVTAVTRAGGRQVFCEGALFPLDRFLFEVETCSDGPAYSPDPLQLTRTQYQRAAGLLGLPAATPQPSSTSSPSPSPT